MLGLPHVTELVRQEVVRHACVSNEDRAPERVPGVAAEQRQPEERRDDHDADTRKHDRARIELEAVEACLRAPEPCLLVGKAVHPR